MTRVEETILRLQTLVNHGKIAGWHHNMDGLGQWTIIHNDSSRAFHSEAEIGAALDTLEGG